jgi:DNA polymerase III subunit gamma/tau
MPVDASGMSVSHQVTPRHLTMPTMSYLVLARKYRPRLFSEMVGQEHVVQALTHALEQQRLHHAYLFTGTRGVGKTTISRVLAKSLNCEKGITAQPCGMCAACTDIDAGRFVDYTELDAASNRSVDEVQQLLEQAVYKPVEGRFKVFMIDEVHMLTQTAFNAMLKTLEEPPEYLKFVLATTDPQKVPVTVLSRCLQFNLRPMAPETISQHLTQVLAAEHIVHDDLALQMISHAARGSMRDALSLTDQAIAFGGGQLMGDSVRQMLGSVDRRHVFEMLKSLARKDAPRMLQLSEQLHESGHSAGLLLEDMSRVLQRTAVWQHAPQNLQEQPDAADLAELATLFAPDELQFLYSLCIHGRAELGLAPDEHSGLNMVLLRHLAFTQPMGQVAEKKTSNLTPSQPEPPAAPPPKVAAPSTAPSTAPSAAPTRSVTPLPVRTTAPAVSPQPATLRAAVPVPVEPVPPKPTITPVPIRSAPQNASLALDRNIEIQPQWTPEGDFWMAVVQDLVKAQSIQSLSRELALQSQLVARDDHAWLLRIERESLRNGQTQQKLQDALAQSGHAVTLSLEMGRVTDSPAKRMAHAEQQKQLKAKQAIEQDPYVQQLISRYDAKIVPGSIQPL